MRFIYKLFAVFFVILFAACENAVVQKESDLLSVSCNLEKINDGEIPDVVLMAGDRIHIPESWL